MKFIKSSILFKYIVLFAFAFFLFSCTNSEQYEKVKKEFRDVEYNNSQESFDSIYAEIPPYSVVTKTINTLHTSFNKSILLKSNSAALYQNSKETAIAFGMYIADLGYVRHFERVQYCMDYLESIKTLAEKLAIGTTEFNEMVPKIEENLTNKEALLSITDSLLNVGSIVLGDNEKYGISALVLGGLWVETTYIGLASNPDIDAEKLEDILQSHFHILTQINQLFNCLSDNSVLNEFKLSLSTLEQKGPQNENLLYDIENIRNRYKK